MTQQLLDQGTRVVNRAAPFIASVLAFLVVVSGVLLIFGSAGGATFTHAGQADQAALFSGPAVIKAEAGVTTLVTQCGKSTHTIQVFSATTNPYQVREVVLSKSMKADVQRGFKLLSDCLLLAMSSNIGGQSCLTSASSAVHPDLATLGLQPYGWFENFGICAAGQGV